MVYLRMPVFTEGRVGEAAESRIGEFSLTAKSLTGNASDYFSTNVCLIKTANCCNLTESRIQLLDDCVVSRQQAHRVMAIIISSSALHLSSPKLD
jgi:hypothetical protein